MCLKLDIDKSLILMLICSKSDKKTTTKETTCNLSRFEDSKMFYGFCDFEQIMTLNPCHVIYPAFANSVNPDQLASEEVN